MSLPNTLSNTWKETLELQRETGDLKVALGGIARQREITSHDIEKPFAAYINKNGKTHEAAPVIAAACVLIHQKSPYTLADLGEKYLTAEKLSPAAANAVAQLCVRFAAGMDAAPGGKNSVERPLSNPSDERFRLAVIGLSLVPENDAKTRAELSQLAEENRYKAGRLTADEFVRDVAKMIWPDLPPEQPRRGRGKAGSSKEAPTPESFASTIRAITFNPDT